MQRAIRAIIRHRRPALILLAALLALALFVASRGVVSSSLAGLFLGDSPEYARFRARDELFGSGEAIVVGVEVRDMLAPDSLARLRALVTALEARAEVARVVSLLDAVEMRTVEGALDLGSYADRAEAEPERRDEVLSRLASDPQVGGLLISKDGRHMALVIELAGEGERGAETYPRLMREVLEDFEEAGFDSRELHRSGMVPVFAEIISESRRNLTVLFPVVGSIVLAIVFLVFRRFWPVVITAVVALAAVTFTMALAVLLFEKINILTAVVPVIVMILAFSDVVHLYSAYLLELEGGKGKKEAIETACGEVGRACFYTSLTTLVGFSAMALVPAPIFRQSAITLGFGVSVSLLLAMTLTPIFLSMTPTPGPWRASRGGGLQRLLDAALGAARRLASRYPFAVLTAFAVVAVGSVLGLTRIQVDTSFADRFPRDHSLRREEAYFLKNFSGTNNLDVLVEAADPDGLLDPATFARIAAFQESLDDLSGVERIVSLVDAMRSLNRALADAGPADELPQSREGLAQYLFLLEMSDGGEAERLIDAERRTMRLRVSLGEGGFMATRELGRAIQRAGSELEEAGIQVQVTGLTYLLGSWLHEIVEGQKRGLLLAFVAISGMMAVALRSLSAGIWAMLPNALPLLVFGGYLGWFRGAVDSDVLIIALVALGIAVDDTIHFLLRFRLETGRGQSLGEAIDTTFHYSGRAIVITTVILSLGFLPCAFSGYLTIRLFGTLLPAVLVTALLADLLVIPALAGLGAFRFHRI